MATLSSHTLNSVNGTHAGGRFKETITLSEADTKASFEIVLQTGEYFEKQNLPQSGKQILKEVIVRFEMPDGNGLYHIPLMLAPNSYSVWWSS